MDKRFWVGSVWVVNLDSLCRWQVQVSVCCARRIPAHLRCIQCSNRLHLIDICFLSCICMWQISQIETCFHGVVDLDLSRHRSASYPAGLYGQLARKR